MPPLWLLKAVLCFVVAGDLLFIREYWTGSKGAWRHDPIGLTMMLEAMFFCGTLGLIVLSVFADLSRLTSAVLAWAEDGQLLACGAMYWWRTVVFRAERKT